MYLIPLRYHGAAWYISVSCDVFFFETEFSDEKNWLFRSCNAQTFWHKLSGYRTLLYFTWLMKSLRDIVFCVKQFGYLFQIFYDMVNIEIKAYVTCKWTQWYVNCHWLRKELYPREVSIKANQFCKSKRKRCHTCIAEAATLDSDVVWILLVVFT